MPQPISLLRVLNLDLRVLPMRTRFPFRYGIASLTALPHLYIRVEVEVDGRAATGHTGEGLPPKWFTKNPATSTEHDIAEMLAVIQNACRLAQAAAREPVTFYDMVRQMEEDQRSWASRLGLPPLLWHLGVSLVERAVLDAVCRALSQPAHEVVRENRLGIDLAGILPELEGIPLKTFLPPAPLERIRARHTVGLADPLRVADIPGDERLHDGLPQALEECIAFYGLRYFKIKLGGVLDADRERLRIILEVLTAGCGQDFKATLDGNENFTDIDSFRAWHESLAGDPTLAPLMDRVLWIEQPLHRSQALSEEVGRALREWPAAPPLIIDESDGETGDSLTALRLGYAGVSHKNCKGILKGLANAAIIARQRDLHPGKAFHLSGEDLVNIGPLALTQDLAMQALLGNTHVERNGHHYFRGLSMHPPALAERMLEAHPDLYGRDGNGLVSLQIREGSISLRSINQAPFGTPVSPDFHGLPTVKEWIMQGGMAALED